MPGKRKPSRKTRIASMSAKRAGEMREYLKVRREFLRLHPFCIACEVFGLKTKPHPATDIHHRRGRIHGLLCDTRFFVPCCRQSHEAIDRNRKLAQRLGLLAGAGEWNVVPKDTRMRVAIP